MGLFLFLFLAFFLLGVRLLGIKITTKPWFIIMIMFASFLLIQETTSFKCLDGWASPSIGIQGACSHHGGVVESLNKKGVVLLYGSIILIVASILIQPWINRGGQQLRKSINSNYEHNNISSTEYRNLLGKIQTSLKLRKKLAIKYLTGNKELIHKIVVPHHIYGSKTDNTLCLCGYCEPLGDIGNFFIHRITCLEIVD